MGIGRLSSLPFCERSLARVHPTGLTTMAALLIGVYGIYLLMVGFKGNSRALVTDIQSDAPAFLPWAVSIAVLAIMYDNKYTHDVAAPFLGLLIIAYIVKNFERLKTNFAAIQQMATSATQTPNEAAP